MASRSFPASSSRTNLGGTTLVDTLSARFTTLFNAIALIPTAIENSSNDYTITLDPALEEDVISGMAFYITPNSAPTGAARIRVGSSNPYYKWTKIDGSDFASGDLSISETYPVVFVDGEFRLQTILSADVSGGGQLDRQVFTSSGTWTKPTDNAFGSNSPVLIRVWGAGGSGGADSAGGGGGGGGSFVEIWKHLSDLGATETVTIGAGGASVSSGNDGNTGGSTTFGSLATAYGGGGGGTSGSTGGGGGGGAGVLEAGTDSTTSDGEDGGGPLGGAGAVGAAGGDPGGDANDGGGGGAGGSSSGNGNSGVGGYATNGGGGGGGGGNNGLSGGAGGNSINGGGGGAGGNTASGGTSLGGGAGGDSPAATNPGGAGTQPGGGGSGADNAASGAGADGQVEVYVWSIP